MDCRRQDNNDLFATEVKDRMSLKFKQPRGGNSQSTRKASSRGNGGVIKSESASSGNNRSLASLFRVQQQRWDAQFESIATRNTDSELKAANLATSNNNIEFKSSVSSSVLLNERDVNSNLGSSTAAETHLSSDFETDTTAYASNGTVLRCERDETQNSKLSSRKNSGGRLSLKRTQSERSPTFDTESHKTENESMHLSLPPVPDESLLNVSDSSSLNVSTVPNVSLVDEDSTVGRNVDDFDKFPYYLENFVAILDDVTNDEFYKGLFNAEDLQTVDSFRKFIDGNTSIPYLIYVRTMHKIKDKM